MNTRFPAALILAAAALTAALAGCQSGSSASPLPTAFNPSVSASAKADLQAVLSTCLPRDSSGQYQVPSSPVAVSAMLKKCSVPKGARLKTASCIVGKITSGLPKDKAAREEAILADVTACIRKYQGGATPAATS